MKNTLNQSLEQQRFPRTFSRYILILGIGITTVLFALLLADIFYVQFPLVTRTGDAQLQKWIGPDTTKLVGIIIGLLFGSCYFMVAVRGTREPETAHAWKLGAAGGTGAGMIVLLLYGITGLNTSSLGELLIPIFVLYGFAFAGNLFIGFLAGKSKGRLSDGAIASFWFGATLALVAALSLLARDALFAQHLASTVWLSDHPRDLTCQRVIGPTLIACEVGDDLGFMANSFLLFPLLGLLLGTVGGTLGRLFSHTQRVRRTPWNAALVTPLICMGFLLLILISEALWNLW